MKELLVLFMIEQAAGMNRAGGVTAQDIANWTGVSAPTARKLLKDYTNKRGSHGTGFELLFEVRQSAATGHGFRFRYQLTKEGWTHLHWNWSKANKIYAEHKERRLAEHRALVGDQKKPAKVSPDQKTSF